MARKKKDKEMPAVSDTPKLKPVRLDLSPEDHHLLRVEAAKADMSMAGYARMVLMRAIKERKAGR